VERVPQVQLTQFLADHVEGLAGVLAGRDVGAVQVAPEGEPASGVRLVQAVAGQVGVPVRRAAYGETGRLGPLTWQVIAPSGPPPPGSESPANDSSVVLLVQVGGIRILLLGDEEEQSQSRLRRETGGVRADVLKVAHHGSASQDPELVHGAGARLAVISVGRDNDYGHPAPSLLALLHETRARVARTDEGGDVAVTVDDGRLGVRERGARGQR
jgi:competence protein ComEC